MSQLKIKNTQRIFVGRTEGNAVWKAKANMGEQYSNGLYGSRMRWLG
jgi:hypothetical protein